MVVILVLFHMQLPILNNRNRIDILPPELIEISVIWLQTHFWTMDDNTYLFQGLYTINEV